MKIQNKQPFAILLAFTVSLVIAGYWSEVQAQEKYPTRAIEVIVPFSPGGATDLSSRLTSSFMSKKWGVPINVVNKPGGNTVPACVELYHAAPDGYTLLGEASSVCYVETVVKKLPFKVLDRTFIAITNVGPQVLFVPASSPYKSLKELAEEVKKKPENFSWVSRGGADPADYQIRQFIKEIGVDHLKTRPIMSQGASQAVTLVAGSHAILGSGSTSSCLAAIKGGLIRPLALSGNQRFADLPDVPTVAEAGYPSATVDNWMGMSGPPKLPAYIVDIWDKAVQQMVKDPEYISKLKNIGAVPYYYNSQQMRQMVIETSAEVKRLWRSE
jgi:tripartite-type tricarboxylate transporter receptor subunit TctC